MPNADLTQAIAEHKDELERLSQSIIDKQPEEFHQTMVGLLVSLASDIPGLSGLVEAGVARAFSLSSETRLQKEYALLRQEEEREQFSNQLADAVATMLKQTLIQILHAQNRDSDDIHQALGGIRKDFEDFRKDLEQRFRELAVVVDDLKIDGGIGFILTNHQTKGVHVRRMTVTRGKGFVV